MKKINEKMEEMFGYVKVALIVAVCELSQKGGRK